MNKLIHLCIAFLCISSHLFAQGNIQVFEGFGSRIGAELIDGSRISVGYVYEADTTTTDFLMMRTSADGEIIWSHTFGTPGEDEGGYHFVLANASRSDVYSGRHRMAVAFNGDIVFDYDTFIGQHVTINDVTKMSDGRLLFACRVKPFHHDYVIMQLSPSGTEPTWYQYVVSEPHPSWPNSIMYGSCDQIEAIAGNKFFANGRTNFPVFDGQSGFDYVFETFTRLGTGGERHHFTANDLAPTNDGNAMAMFAHGVQRLSSDGELLEFICVDLNGGRKIFQRTNGEMVVVFAGHWKIYDEDFNYLRMHDAAFLGGISVIESVNGTFLVGGYARGLIGPNQYVIVETDTDGMFWTNKLDARFRVDHDFDCQISDTETEMIGGVLTYKELMFRTDVANRVGVGDCSVEPIFESVENTFCSGELSYTFNDVNQEADLGLIAQDTCIDIQNEFIIDGLCGDSLINVQLNVSGGFGVFSYEWDNGDTSSLAQNLSAGVHHVTITNGYCTHIDSIDLSEYQEGQFNSFFPKQGLCVPGVYSLDLADFECIGCAYVWEDGSDALSTEFVVAQDTLLLLTITNETGCAITKEVEIKFSSLFISTNNVMIDPTGCLEPNGSIEISGNGGLFHHPYHRDYIYEWSTGDTTKLGEIDNLLPGEYAVTVSDDHCEVEASYVVPISTAPNIYDYKYNKTPVLATAYSVDTLLTVYTAAEGTYEFRLQPMNLHQADSPIGVLEVEEFDDLIFNKNIGVIYVLDASDTLNQISAYDLSMNLLASYTPAISEPFVDWKLNSNGEIYVLLDTKEGNAQIPADGNYTNGRVIKLGATLDEMWNKIYGGSKWESLYSSDVKSNGNLVVAARTNSTDNDLLGFDVGFKMWIFEIDTEGTIIYSQSMPSNIYEISDLVVTHQDEVFFSNSNYLSEGSIELLEGGGTFWQARLNPDLTIAKINASTTLPSVFNLDGLGRLGLYPYQNGVLHIFRTIDWQEKYETYAYFYDRNLNYRWRRLLRFDEIKDCVQTKESEFIIVGEKLITNLPPWSDEERYGMHRISGNTPLPFFEMPDVITQCEDGFAQLEIEEPNVEYLWDNGDTIATPTFTQSGVYTLVATNEYGCQSIDSLEVQIVANSIALALGEDEAICAPLVLDAENPGMSYKWNDDFYNNEQTIEVTQSGIYTVEVTSEEGCMKSDTIEFDYYEGFQNEIAITNVNCFGESSGAILMNSDTGDYVYQWDYLSANMANLDGVAAGAYIVEVVDSITQCLIIDTIMVQEVTSAALAPAIQIATQLDCLIDSTFVFATAQGGQSPYYFDWSNGESADSVYLAWGDYVLSITDDLGCTDTIDFSIADMVVISVGGFATNPSGMNQTNGSIELDISGGSPFVDDSGEEYYILSWSDGTLTIDPIRQDLGVGNYEVTVTDAMNCETIQSFELSAVNSANELAALEKSINLYPNPTNSNCSIQLNNDEWTIEALQIIDPLGKVIDQLVFDHSISEWTYEVANLPAGIYILNIGTNVGRVQKTMIVIR